MINILRTDSNNPDFISLVRQLDAFLAELDGEEHGFYAQFNNINLLKNAIVIYEDELPVSCGAMKEVETGTMEIKRMYTLSSHRGKGFATKILHELESWAAELNYKKCKLETGARQPEAIALYRKNGYTQIPNYGQYTGVYNSVCFEKYLTPSAST